MKKEGLLIRYLERRNKRGRPAMAVMFKLLRTGTDWPITELYAAIAGDGPEKPYRYQQQHVGSRVAKFNKLFPRFGMNVIIKPGKVPRTYRIYRRGE